MFCTFLSNQTFQTQLRFKEQLVEYIFLRNTAWAEASECLLCLFFGQFRWQWHFFAPGFNLSWLETSLCANVGSTTVREAQGSPEDIRGEVWDPSILRVSAQGKSTGEGREAGGGWESCKAVGFVPFSDESWIRELVISTPQITRLTKVDSFRFLFSAFQAF